MKKSFGHNTLRAVFLLLVSSLLLVSCSELENSDGQNATAIGEDPFYAFQWHLKNTGQLGGVEGEDLNAEPAWITSKGEDTLVVVVDDGLEISHPDLSPNIASEMSYNYISSSAGDLNDPTSYFNNHGTSVAGVIAARDNNAIGVKGVAPRASLAGYNLLQDFTSANEADAMVRNKDEVAVSNNSWGPPDALGEFTDSSSTWRSAIQTGIASGRSGKGIVYVWAGGNGYFSYGNVADTDRSDYDGYANYYGVMAVCAVGDDGARAYYSEKGSNLWVCGLSLGASGNGIATTDLTSGNYGYNTTGDVDNLSDYDYTNSFSGTSAAVPMVSGVAALVLSVNPTLTWRDVKIILARSARKNDAHDLGWELNGATPPYWINLSYGFGVVDAAAAVAEALAWNNVGPLMTDTYGPTVVNANIQDDGTPVTSEIVVVDSTVSKIEFVEVTVQISHSDWGALEITLERSGDITTHSPLAAQHSCYSDSNGTTPVNCTVSGNSFRFGSARHLGEPADGTWTLRVTDRETGNAVSGILQQWTLKFYGE